MALFRGIQEYIARDANNIARVFDSGNIVSIEGNIFLYPPKKSHPILLLLYIGLCVSSYYLTIVSDCQLSFFLFTNSAYRVCACVERSSLGNTCIPVIYYCPGNNLAKHAQIYVDNIILCHKARGIHDFILATKSPMNNNI